MEGMEGKTKEQLIAELETLQQAHNEMEAQLEKRSRDIEERVKELNCLYRIANLVEEPGISLRNRLPRLPTSETAKS